MSKEDSRITTLTSVLTEQYKVTDPDLVKALVALGEAACSITKLCANYVSHTYAGTQNTSGDDQLHLDIDCDNAVFDALRKSGVYAIAASEETPVETSVAGDNNGEGKFSVGFDPLDGSSIIDANFTVGSIFGIWPGKGVLGRTGREQVASCVALFGPRTTLLMALPKASTGLNEDTVFEVTLTQELSIWEVSREKVSIQKNGKIFSPGNLRASNDNEKYNTLIQYWISERYTLRYTGGMVPDVYHIFAKSKGVFSNVSSEKAKAKLRLLYEVAPIGLLVECAGGCTTHESKDMSVLDDVIDDLDKRLGVCFGSADEVATYKKFMEL